VQCQKNSKRNKIIESGASIAFSTPHKERPRNSPLSTLGDFDESLVRGTINDFHIVEKQRPAPRNGQKTLRKTIVFQGCTSTLKKIILKLGLNWKKTKNNRMILVKGERARFHP
jgi:hypothetical protein